jgi:hypothetical protein
MPHPDTCPAHAAIADRLAGLHNKLDRIIIAVCGDLDAQEPGLAERLRALELKVKVILTGIIAILSCLASLLAFIGSTKIVAALRCLFTA